MPPYSHQQKLFAAVKDKILPGESLVERIAEILAISTDSAYRRIRDEKPLTLDEFHLLCEKFKISADELLGLEMGLIPFAGKNVNPATFRFNEYLTSMMQNVAYMNKFKERQLVGMWKDLPVFYHFLYPELAAFKHYFWMKTVMNFPDFRNKPFSFDDYPAELFDLGRKCLAYYNQIDTVEFWSIETINSTIRQIDFYRHTGMFHTASDALRIYEALEKTMEHLEKQASAGYKYDLADPSKTRAGKYELYFNEIIIGDNSLLAILDGSKAAYIVHTTINFMLTRDIGFCDNMYEYIQNMKKKSTMISTVSEKERARMFKHIRERILRKKKELFA